MFYYSDFITKNYLRTTLSFSGLSKSGSSTHGSAKSTRPCKSTTPHTTTIVIAAFQYAASTTTATPTTPRTPKKLFFLQDRLVRSMYRNLETFFDWKSFHPRLNSSWRRRGLHHFRWDTWRSHITQQQSSYSATFHFFRSRLPANGVTRTIFNGFSL